VSDKVFTNARMWFSDRALVEVVTMQVSYNLFIERHNLRGGRAFIIALQEL
jgi:hypothetical protein